MTQQEIESQLQKAVFCLDRNDVDGFRSILHRVQKENVLSDWLRGEILLLTVVGKEIPFERTKEALLRAEQLIGGSSKIMAPHMHIGENHYDALMIWGREYGKADALNAARDEIAEVAKVFQRLTGFGAGINECFQAQLAFYRGDFKSALKFAETEIPPNMPSGRTNLIKVYMLEVMAGIAKHTMNIELWRSSYGKLRALASGEMPASRSCREQAEVVCMMLEMSLGCLHEVPEWVRTGDFGVIPAPHGYEIISDRLLTSTLPTAMVAHMEYLSYSADPARALQTASIIQQVFDVRNAVLDSYVEFLRAGCFFHLNKQRYAQEAVRRGMEMIAGNGLWLIAAEFVPAFGEAVYAAAAQVDPSAPEKIRRIGEGFGEKLIPLRNEILRGSAEGLTKREQQVMDLAMKGYSNAEIAKEMNISVRTVRFHLENVYSKLNISRRSKFVGDMEQNGLRKLAYWVK